MTTVRPKESTLRQALALLLSLSLVSACSGGGDSSLSGTQNSGLSGQLILDPGLDQPLEVVDLASGLTSEIQGPDWSAMATYGTGTGGFDAYPNAHGNYANTEIAVVLNDCAPTDAGTGLAPYEDCLQIIDINGVEKSILAFDTDIFSPTISPDGAHIALYRKQGPSISSSDSLIVITREGNYVNGFDFSSPLAYQAGFDWVDATTLFFAAGDEMGILDIHSPNGPGSFSFPTIPGNNVVSSVDASPDGGRILFMLDDTIMIMNRDGTQLRELVRSTENRRLRNPAWSPDSTRVLFSFGYINDTGIPDIGLNEGVPLWKLLALPVNGTEALLLRDDISTLPVGVTALHRQGNNGVTTDWPMAYRLTWKTD